MKKLPHFLATVLLLAAPLTLRADLLPPTTQDKPESPLHTAMETMGKTFRGLNRGLQTPDPARKADYLAALQTIEAAAVEAKKHVPPSIAGLPEAEQAAKLVAYRSDLASAIETMLQLERAILADDWPAAQALAKKLGGQRKDGHEKYDPEDEKEKKP